MLNDEEITAISIRDRFLGKLESHYTIIGVLKEYNRKLEILVGSEYTKGTAERYRTNYPAIIYLSERGQLD
ncbi:hypothetical protein GCM10011413_08490 [Pedobacter psychrotolerans]|nr:hypothetical protein GCM10011413_08490 [Pedobacter psychrotolerans]